MPTSEDDDKKQPERCERCRNYLTICGHDLPFMERAKDIQIDRSSLRVH